MSIGFLAFRIGRRIGKHPLAGRIFCLMQPVLPLQRVARADGVVAFHHPRPMADSHILIVPTRPMASLSTNKLSPAEKADILWRMLQLASEITEEQSPEASWQLVINGGTRQDIGQMHGHLLASDDITAPAGAEISDPGQDLECWITIFTEIQHADTFPGSGYSLEVRWVQQVVPVATVTQSAMYV